MEIKAIILTGHVLVSVVTEPFDCKSSICFLEIFVKNIGVARILDPIKFDLISLSLIFIFMTIPLPITQHQKISKQ